MKTHRRNRVCVFNTYVFFLKRRQVIMFGNICVGAYDDYSAVCTSSRSIVTIVEIIMQRYKKNSHLYFTIMYLCMQCIIEL